MAGFAHASKSRLTRHDLPRFPGRTLFDRIARAVCDAGCLPRKELYEAWEVARRARRMFRGGRVIDAAGGHGLLAHIMILLDDTSPRAVVVDTHVPKSALALHESMAAAWPRLQARIEYVAADFESMPLSADDVVVSCHACGSLTDRVIDRAAAAGARLAVLPCCHDAAACDAGPLAGWLDRGMAIDAMRAIHLQARGYRVSTHTVPATITPKNRLLLGRPASAEQPMRAAAPRSADTAAAPSIPADAPSWRPHPTPTEE